MKEVKTFRVFYVIIGILSFLCAFPACFYSALIAATQEGVEKFLALLIYSICAIFLLIMCIVSSWDLFSIYKKVLLEEDLGANNYSNLVNTLGRYVAAFLSSIVSAFCFLTMIIISLGITEDVFVLVKGTKGLVVVLAIGMLCALSVTVITCKLRKRIKNLLKSKGMYYVMWTNIFEEIDEIVDSQVRYAVNMAKANPEKDLLDFVDEEKIKARILEIKEIFEISGEDFKNLCTETTILVIRKAAAKFYGLSMEKVVHTHPKPFEGSICIAGRIFITKTSDWMDEKTEESSEG